MLSIAWKDLLILFKDRNALIGAFVLPIVFVVVYPGVAGAAGGGRGDSAGNDTGTVQTRRMPLVVVNNDAAGVHVPSSFVCLEKFPLTATGKVARRALPSPGNKRPDLDSQYLSPRTPIEATLENIWSDILGIEELGVNDSFFDLGGHSLTAMRVISRVIQDFQLEIPLQSLFQAPTIAEMAEVIADHQGKALHQQGLAALLDDLESLSEEDAKKFAGDLKSEDSKH